MGDVSMRLTIADDASSKLQKVAATAKNTATAMSQAGKSIDKAFSSSAPDTFASAAGSAFESIDDQAESLGNTIDQMFSDADFDGFVKDISGGFDEATQSANKFSDAASAAGKNVEELGKTAEQLGESADGIGDGNGFDGLSEGAKGAGESMDRAEGKALNLTSALKKLFAVVSAAAIMHQVGGFVSDSIDIGRDFTSMMSEVGAISGASSSQMMQLETTAREYGATTVFSATEAAEALKYMSLAGWSAQQSTDALGGVLDLAAASGMGLGQASDMVTDYLSAFGMQASKSAYFADMLSYAQSNSNTTAEQLGEAYKNSAANLNAAGQDVETVTSFLEGMANQGYKGSEAGTALAAIMRDITNAMEDGAIKIGKTSIAVQDAEGNYRDLTNIVSDVSDAVDGMGTAERAAALSSTFTADSTKGLNLLLNEGIDKIAGYEDALRSAGGTAEKMAGTMNDNLTGDMANMNSVFEEMKLQVFEGMEEPLREGVQYITSEVIPTLTEWVPEAFGTLASGASKLGTALKPLFETVLKNPQAIATAFSSLGAGILAFKGLGVASNIMNAVSGTTELTGVLGKLGGVLTGNPWVAGAAALTAGVVMIKGAVDQYNELQVGKSLSEHFGDIELSKAEISEMAGKMAGVEWVADINLALGEFENAEQFREDAEEALNRNKVLMWKASVSTQLEQMGGEDYISPFVGAIQDVLDGKTDSNGLEYLANVDTTLNPSGGDNTVLVQNLVDFANGAVAGAEASELEEYAKDVAMELRPEGGNNTALVQSLVDFANGVVSGAAGEDLDPYLDNVLVNLTPEGGDSFMSALAELTGDITSQKLNPGPTYEDTVSVKLTPEMQEEYKSNIESFITNKYEELQSLTLAAKESVQTVLGQEAGASLISSIQQFAVEDSAELEGLSSSLTQLVQGALEDGVLDVEEQAAIDILQTKVNNILSGWKEAESQAEWQMMEMKWSGRQLTSDSFTSLIEEAHEQRSTAFEALDADTKNMLSIFNAWENSGKITAGQHTQLQDLWNYNYRNLEGESMAKSLGFETNTLQDTYGDLISTNLERISTMGGADTMEWLNNSAANGNWENVASQFWSNRSFYSENGGADRKALLEMYESMKPDVADMGGLIDSYKKDGMAVPQALMDAYNQAIEIGAAAGDSDAAWQKYANTMLESGNEQLLDALSNQDNPMYEMLRNQMPEELASAVDRALYAAENATMDTDLSELFNSVLGLESGETTIDLAKLQSLCEKYGLDISEYLESKGIDVEAGNTKINLEDFDPSQAAELSGLTATGNTITLPGGEVALEYEVNTADTLSGIAEKNGIALEELQAANQQIYDERGTWDLIYEGDLIYIPNAELDESKVTTAMEEMEQEAQAAADATDSTIEAETTVNETLVAGERDDSALVQPAEGLDQEVIVNTKVSAGETDTTEIEAVGTAAGEAITESISGEEGTATASGTEIAAATVSATATELGNTGSITSAAGGFGSVIAGAINASASAAISAARSLGSSVIFALQSAMSSGISVNVPVHLGASASGDFTIVKHALGGYFDSPHVGMVAEAGVGEYIIPMDGSDRSKEMWSEAGRMLGVEDKPLSIMPSAKPVSATGGESDEGSSSSKRTIDLNINGNGRIQVDGNMSKEDVVAVMLENVKDVLMQILEQDVLEEGDLAYEF